MGEKLTRTQLKNLERLGGVNPADEPFSRRQFLMQAGGTGLLVGGAVAGGIVMRDRWGMEGVEPPPPGPAQGLFGRHAVEPAERGRRALEPAPGRGGQGLRLERGGDAGA